MNCFFGKLLPPRATFPADMTPDEARLMQAHAAYWRELMKRGLVVVFGPVADPQGAYGILVLQLPDDVQPAALTEDDPVMKAGAGFRFEVHPMRAVLPDRAD
jgi:uncharacterized protein YciI